MASGDESIVLKPCVKDPDEERMLSFFGAVIAKSEVVGFAIAVDKHAVGMIVADEFTIASYF